MQLYSRNGPQTVVHEGNQYATGKDDVINVPDDFGRLLHHTHIGGLQVWETGQERKDRMEAEELARRRDPANLYDLLARQQKPDTASIQAAIDAAVEAALTVERAKHAPEASKAEPVKRGPGRPRKSA